MGTSISIDILKIENDSASAPPEVWIRVPRDDAAAVFAALSSWVGALPAAATSSLSSSYEGAAESSADGESGVAWRVCAKGNYLAAIVHGSGEDVFRP
jgi:ribonuclease P/MRP protein subunit POP8